jgi:hypothetical protein
MIGAPLLQGVAGGSILGLSTGALGAGLAGITSLAQGKGILGAGMDALGGYGGASGIGKLANFGNQQLASGAAGTLYDGASTAIDATGTFSPSIIDKLGAGVEGLTKQGGADAFKAATGSSALSSLGMPAAGALVGAMSPTNLAVAPTQESYWGGPSESVEDLRRRVRGYAEGGITDLGMTAGAFDARTKLPAYNEPMDTYAKGGVLSGPGDGVSDSIPAVIGDKQPARLADGEFVIPARIVSELGNGSTKAGARRLYEMMDRVKKRREKSVGKHNIAVDTKAYKELPA